MADLEKKFEELEAKIAKLELDLAKEKAVTQIQNVMGRYAYMHTGGMHTLCSHLFAEGDPELSIEIGPGGVFYGPDAAYRAYTIGHNAGEGNRLGFMAEHTLTTPVIEVADDLKSVRSYYMTPGTMGGVTGSQGGRSGGWLWERYGSEFVYRDGRWWWFHEQVCPDLAGDMDAENWAQDRFRAYLDGSLKVGNASAPPKGGISDLRSIHNDVSIVQTVQDTVPAPEPYETLDEAHTYSPGCTAFEDVYIYPPTQGYGDPIY